MYGRCAGEVREILDGGALDEFCFFSDNRLFMNRFVIEAVHPKPSRTLKIGGDRIPPTANCSWHLFGRSTTCHGVAPGVIFSHPHCRHHTVTGGARAKGVPGAVCSGRNSVAPDFQRSARFGVHSFDSNRQSKTILHAKRGAQF